MRDSSLAKKLVFLGVCLAIAPFPIGSSFRRQIAAVVVSLDRACEDDLASLIAQHPAWEPIRYARQMTPEDSVFFSFRIAEFPYYSRRKCICCTDPRVVPVYQQEDTVSAYKALRELGVDYVYMPDYITPEICKTQLAGVLSDLRLCELVEFEQGYRLLWLRRTPVQVVHDPFPLGLDDVWVKRGKRPWSELPHREDRPSPASPSSAETAVKPRGVVTIANPRRRQEVQMFLGCGDHRSPQSLPALPDGAREKRCDPQATYHFKASVRGEGRFAVALWEFVKDETAGDTTPDAYGQDAENSAPLLRIRSASTLWRSVLDDDFQDVECLFKLTPTTTHFRIVFTLLEGDELSFRDVALEKVEVAAGAASNHKTVLSREKGNVRNLRNSPS